MRGHALVASRSLVGLLNGNIGVLKSILGEITDDTNAAKGFAAFLSFGVVPIAVVAVVSFLGGRLRRSDQSGTTEATGREVSIGPEEFRKS